jgi:hypothetical protein
MKIDDLRRTAMGLNKEISVKWEAVIWIPAYAFAYMVIEAVCTESH